MASSKAMWTGLFACALAVAASSASAAGFVVVSGDDADDFEHCSYIDVATEDVPGGFTEAAPTPDLVALSPGTTAANLSHCCFHNVFTGPPGYSGLDVLAVATNAPGSAHGMPVMRHQNEPAALRAMAHALLLRACLA